MKVGSRVGGAGGEVEIIVEDRDGRVIKHIRKQMDSFVSNIKDLIAMFDTGGWSVRDKNGNAVVFAFKYATDNYLYNAEVLAPEGDDNYGIIVGESSTDFNVTDYWLYAQISHGTGAGQLEYGETVVLDYGDDYKTWQRNFDNSYGGDINVHEIGIAAKVTREEGGTQVEYFVLLARDVIPATTVPEGGRLTVRYTFKINPY